MGVNITALELKYTPSSLKHAIRMHLTNDGNFHLNLYRKKRSVDDVYFELWGENGYSPSSSNLREYLSKIKVQTEVSTVRRHLMTVLTKSQKSQCSFLVAVNFQNKGKFKNQEVTGVVHTQCDHIIVRATVDLQRGERCVD